MTDYLDFLKTKQKSHTISGFDVDEKELNKNGNYYPDRP